MSTGEPEPTMHTDIPSAADCAEAAAWIAKIHGQERTPQLEQGLRRWLNESAAHRAAFEMANDIWTSAERLPKPAAPILAIRSPLRPRLLVLATAATVLIAAAVAFFRMYAPGIATTIGEQRTLALEDGTRVYLNTDTQVIQHYDKHARRIELKKGEALFEVAKSPNWPFIVIAGDREVRALGTAFVVRRDSDQFAVTLVEGKVTVSPAAGDAALEHDAPRQLTTRDTSSPVSREAPASPPAEAAVTLTPGQRLTFADAAGADAAPRLDTPPLERITAWQRGQVILDHTPLADAVAEMNRYSTTRIEIEQPQTADALITGVFRIGDSAEFASAVAETYDLRVTHVAGKIVIGGIVPAQTVSP
jgi:transmembrane sensor